MTDFRVVNGCPVNSLIAPYIALILADAGAVAQSIYRGDDAKGILHAHGHHTQQELIDAGYRADAVDESTHCLRSDGRAYPSVPVRGYLQLWQQGFDVNDGSVAEVIRQAAWHRWHVYQPYPGTVEFHHLNFLVRPRPTPHTLARIVRLRASLPRS